MNPATMSGSTIDVVVAEWIVAAVRDGISFLIKVRLSFVADRLISPFCDCREGKASISRSAIQSQLSKRSRTVATNMIVPAMPIVPAAIKGVSGASFHSSPPTAAAGVIARLRIR